MDEKLSIYFTTLQLIATNGLQFSTADISKREKISKRKIYQLFNSKDQLIEESLFFALDQITQTEQAISTDSLSYREKLKQGFLQMPQNYSFGSLMSHSQELSQKYPKVALKLTQTFEKSLDLMMATITAGIAAGEFRTVNLPLLRGLLTDAFTKLYTPNFLTEQLSLTEALMDLFTIFFDGLSK